LPSWQQMVSSFQPDLVHVWGTEYAVGLLAGLIPCPCVVDIQGVMTVYYSMASRGVDGDYRRSFSPRLMAHGGGQVLAPFMLKIQARNERRVLEANSFFLGRTRFDRALVDVFSNNGQYFHCDRIIQPEFWAQEWASASVTEPVVLSTIGEYGRKGLGTLLDAVALLRVRNPGMRIRLAGNAGGTEGERALRRKISRLSLGSAVSILGPLPPAELANELVHARVFVHPSHCDNSPNSLAEAMVVGTPCVATAVGGVPSLARDGIEALLVQDGDPISLAAALMSVLADGALADRLSVAGRQVARQRHDPSRVQANLLRAYAAITTVTSNT
jgi:glycosyltransferase involved in cell wall biosynthesis